MSFFGGETAFGRLLELRAGRIPIPRRRGGFDIGGGEILGGWKERSFVDGAVGAGNFFGRVDVGVEGAQRELAAEFGEVGFGGSVG